MSGLYLGVHADAKQHVNVKQRTEIVFSHWQGYLPGQLYCLGSMYGTPGPTHHFISGLYE